MTALIGFILIPYGTLGIFRASELLRRARLPLVDCAVMSLLGLTLVFSGLALLLGLPLQLPIIGVVAGWRALTLYNVRLRRGRLARNDVVPGSLPDLALALLLALSSH